MSSLMLPKKKKKEKSMTLFSNRTTFNFYRSKTFTNNIIDYDIDIKITIMVVYIKVLGLFRIL